MNAGSFSSSADSETPQPRHTVQHAGRVYSFGNEIGRGAFGTVYECWDEWENDLVAKIVSPVGRTYEQVRDEWDRELSNLVILRHPNITFIYDAFEYGNSFYLIVERCSATLDSLIRQPNLPGNEWIPRVARDVLSALDFIHRQGYAHKDLHPGNIFVSQTKDRIATDQWILQFKIGDLGISRVEAEIRGLGTVLAPWMLPPEFLRPEEFGALGRQIDIYHIGLLLLSIASNRIWEFTYEQVVDGHPRQLAEALDSPYAPAIAAALRRHVQHRTQSPIDLWRHILQCRPTEGSVA